MGRTQSVRLLGMLSEMHIVNMGNRRSAVLAGFPESVAAWRRFITNAVVARALQIPAETEALGLERVRGWDAKPEVSFTSHLHPRPGLTKEEDFERPLYEMIRERTSVVADDSFEELIAEAADKRLARLLQVPEGMPLLRREGTVLDTGGRPMEFAIVRDRCDRFRLTLSLRQEF